MTRKPQLSSWYYYLNLNCADCGFGPASESDGDCRMKPPGTGNSEMPVDAFDVMSTTWTAASEHKEQAEDQLRPSQTLGRMRTT